MSVPEPKLDSFLRLARAWLLLPIVGYLFAIPALGPGAIFVPIVIRNAPLGIIGCFEKISLEPEGHQKSLIVLIHCAFWVLFVTGYGARQSLPLGWLRLLWAVLVIAIIMSIAGCAAQLGPGLKNDGNWH